MLVADADVPFPVIRGLKILRYPIATFDEIGAPVRPDKALMENVLRYSRVLVTRDMGIYHRKPTWRSIPLKAFRLRYYAGKHRLPRTFRK